MSIFNYLVSIVGMVGTKAISIEAWREETEALVDHLVSESASAPQLSEDQIRQLLTDLNDLMAICQMLKIKVGKVDRGDRSKIIDLVLKQLRTKK